MFRRRRRMYFHNLLSSCCNSFITHSQVCYLWILQEHRHISFSLPKPRKSVHKRHKALWLSWPSWSYYANFQVNILNGQQVASQSIRVWRIMPSKEALTMKAGVLSIVTFAQISDRICSNVYTVSSIQVDFQFFCVPEWTQISGWGIGSSNLEPLYHRYIVIVPSELL